MTDERNNSDKSCSNNNKTTTNTTPNNQNSIANNNSERIIAEAAKILLKNGLNGTTAAVAAAAAATATLLSAAATFQLPAPPPLFSATPTKTTTSSAITPTTVITNGLLPHSILSLSPSSTSLSAPTATSYTMATAAANAHVAPPPPTSAGIVKTDTGVLDYTLNNVAAVTASAQSLTNNSAHKFTGSNNHDMSRHPVPISNNNTNATYGGRLQFFKDGKFILELARSKDGEKGGWVSVPRKLFRVPSAATSATVTPTSAPTTTYPKNESSTSLSFSDDNSSIQSSPWQRDHSWKQSTPRRGISTEMSLLYWRPKDLLLTKCGLKAALRKRRRPYEVSQNVVDMFQHLEQTVEVDDCNVTLKAEDDTTIAQDLKREDDEEKANGNDDVVTVESTTDKNDCTDGTSIEHDNLKSDMKKNDENTVSGDFQNSTLTEKMNTSEDDDAMSIAALEEPTKATVNGAAVVVDDDEPHDNSVKEEFAQTTIKHDTKRSTAEGDVEKRLKKHKTRAKLNTIIQKLIEGIPARKEHLSKTAVAAISGTGGGAINSISNSWSHKISPPSSASAASRLVEYHQQHVSPRKRILREFEKVTLEDSTVGVGAGGKRSRAKSNTSAAKSSPSRNNTIHTSLTVNNNNNCNASTTTKSNAVGTTANNQHIPKTSKAAATPPTTRLYSSYSIHSLLGGSGSSSSSSSSSSRKIHEQQSTVVSNIHQLQSHYSESSYQSRMVLASPKSPEGTDVGGSGGKSPSHVINKKRSPPYSSPMHDSHSRSPTVVTDYARRTSPENAASNYKMHLAHHHHQQQQQHQMHQAQNFYSPYAMSPQYVPAPGTSISPTNLVRSTATTSTSVSLSSSSSSHIPHVTISALSSRELSPPRSSTSSPREPITTPRTVPKKTASIRREFSSPTASNSSTATSCPSPSERALTPDRKSSSGSSHLGSQHQSHAALQRGSPSTITGSPLHYYMYPPPPNGTGSGHTQPPVHAVTVPTSMSNSAAAAAAAAAAYIPSVVSPSFYHPYISALAAIRHNPMWLNHYQNTASTPLLPPHHLAAAAASQAAASRLSPPFHSFAYNGVGGFGQSPSNTQMTQNPILALHPQHHILSSSSPQASSLAAIHGGHRMGGTTSAERRTQSPKLTDSTDPSSTVTKHASSSSASSTSSSYSTSAVAAMSSGSIQSTLFHNSLRDELSSDVPLNLSKH